MSVTLSPRQCVHGARPRKLRTFAEGKATLIDSPVLKPNATSPAGSDGAKGAKGPSRMPVSNLDETSYRVVIWGMAIPAAADAWTLYLFQSGGVAHGQSRLEIEIPLPPAGHRLLTIRPAGGAAITAFSTDSDDAPRIFYDRWFSAHGWAAEQGWQQLDSGWHARFEKRQAAVAAVDIRLAIDKQGQWTGLVLESQRERSKP